MGFPGLDPEKMVKDRLMKADEDNNHVPDVEQMGAIKVKFEAGASEVIHAIDHDKTEAAIVELRAGGTALLAATPNLEKLEAELVEFAKDTKSNPEDCIADLKAIAATMVQTIGAVKAASADIGGGLASLEAAVNKDQVKAGYAQIKSGFDDVHNYVEGVKAAHSKKK
ncbi:MAG: hypothetical protein EKK48_12205 [Candidatus Melainabacteria bacterium]|nr:MAG: hypothetical protein EKK48_12205 [Candidatus Melainabacteria bacterium]